MHLFSRAIGLKTITSRDKMDKLIRGIVSKAIKNNMIKYCPALDNEGELQEAQLDYPLLIDKACNREIAGLTIRGMYDKDKNRFQKLFYYPYVKSYYPISGMKINIERLSDKEAYMVHCSESTKEVSPVFYLNNIVEYLKDGKKETYTDKDVVLSALSFDGKIIFPVKKSEKQEEKVRTEAKERGMLVDKALQGDQAAIDDLTVEDYDTLSNVCRRVRKEDIFSIVDSSFIPTGLECQAYSVIGNIQSVEQFENVFTGELVYYMLLECNEVFYYLAINSLDLLGIPKCGYRFVGKIWLSGEICI